ncbi:Nitrite facilitator 2 [Kluyvera cryocrescens]|uniref:Nitrite facilitator 2 n=1 Tax=Kluyvera cryocrescens TaxID=580 RepID=A0A485CTF2_KLUCR|nr:Nitrite facilitator 2 [Kluyvera cryocrescens]
MANNEKENHYLLKDWKPENSAFWENKGKSIARRNLWISVACLLLAFCVWMLFSAVAVNLNKVGFNFTTDQLFLLTALPSLSGAILRVPYSFMVPILGGRRWTVISTIILVIPCAWLGLAIQNTATPYWVFITIALLCGFAGANFASSMGNISFFFPKAKQGSALGVNGGLGNLGVSVMQMVAPGGYFPADVHLYRLPWRRSGRWLDANAQQCCHHLGTAVNYRDARCLVWYERHCQLESVGARSTAGIEAPAHVVTEPALSCDIWFVLSVFLPVSPCWQKPSSRTSTS